MSNNGQNEETFLSDNVMLLERLIAKKFFNRLIYKNLINCPIT